MKTIAIVAPSQSAATVSSAKLDKALKFFEQRDYICKFSDYAFEKDDLGCSSIDSRVKDLHAAFIDPDVDIIFAVKGGFYVNQLLPYLNRDLIAKNQKPFFGFSDLSILLNAMYVETGNLVYHAPCFRNFGYVKKEQLAYMGESFEQALSGQSYFFSPSDVRQDVAHGGKETKNDGYRILQKGAASGTILGGNICSFNLLQGTEYMPSLEDSILFLEDDDEVWKEFSPGEFDRNLESICQQKDFAGVKALVIGRFQTQANIDRKVLAQIISNKRQLKGLPIIANVDFGHTYPMATFPIGGTCVLDTSKSQEEMIQIYFD